MKFFSAVIETALGNIGAARAPRVYGENVANNRQWESNSRIGKCEIGYWPRDYLCIKIINGVESKVLQEKWQLFVLTPPCHVYLHRRCLVYEYIQRCFRYARLLPRRCNFLHSLFLCTPSWPANFARVETAFPSRFLCTRFNLFCVKYRASATRHGEINFSKLPSTHDFTFFFNFLFCEELHPIEIRPQFN